MSIIDFFRDSDRVTNVKIVCKDGLVFTHKIIVASVNNFFKDILSIIPDGDEAVLIMPGHEKREIDAMLLLDWLQGVRKYDSSCTIRDVKIEPDPNPEPGDPPEEIELDETANNTFDKETKMEQNKKENDESAKATKEEMENAFEYTNYFENIEKQDYQNSITKLLDELERKTSTSPSNPGEEKMFKLLQKQINYEKAKLDLLTGKIKTIRRACKVHGGLHDGTLKRLFVEKKSFVGHSRIGLKAFTTLEEHTIIDDFVQRNNGVKEYNQKLMDTVILEKMKDIQKSDPERSFSKFVSDDGKFTQKQFAYKIARRLGLSSKRTDREGQFECEICCKIYTMKPSLAKHLRDVHFL